MRTCPDCCIGLCSHCNMFKFCDEKIELDRLEKQVLEEIGEDVLDGDIQLIIK